MSSRAMTGTPPDVTLATLSGRMRSNADAKIMRVELRNTVPHHPNTIREMAAMKITWKTLLLTIQAVIAVGERYSPAPGTAAGSM